MKSVSVLAFDAGAGSGRLFDAGFDGSRIGLNQVSRFRNGSIKAGRSLYWDILGIYRGLTEGLESAKAQGIDARSLGIDTWGNDFVLLDEQDCLMENPYSHRDTRTVAAVEYVRNRIADRELYFRNGIQHVRMNTLYQLASLVRDRPRVLEYAERFLFVPDFLTFLLTGLKRCEYTMATISQLYSYASGTWDYGLMKLLGIPPSLFPPIIIPGTPAGTILASVCRDLEIDPLPLITVGAHDTASAVVGVPEPEGNAVYISSGTWSIVGTETASPVINEVSFGYNFANEGGVGGGVRLIRNVMGMWIVGEILRRWKLKGKNLSFREASGCAEAAGPFGPVIDPDDYRFYEPTDMPEMVRGYCRETGQRVPETDGEILRCVKESLALKYRLVVERLGRLTGRRAGKIHIVGGGSNDAFLNQLTADYCGCPVYAGPEEATVLGNAAVQFISLGELSGLKEAREIIKASFPPAEFLPNRNGRVEDHYRHFLEVTGLE